MHNDRSDESFLGSKDVPQIDFSHYTKYMLGQKPKPHKSHFGQLSKLRCDGLLVKNKLSDKLGRRDIQFYDLHKLG